MYDDKVKNELNEHCRAIAKLLHVRQGTIEINCHEGEPTFVRAHDKKTVKFDEKWN